MNRNLLFLCAAALAGCAPVAQRSPDPGPDAAVSSSDPAPPSSQPPALVTEAELFGQWRLVSLSAASLDQAPPLHLLFGHGRIEAASQCVPFLFAFEADDRSVRIRPLPWPGPVCARGLLESEERFPRVMAAASRIERRSDGRIAFVGGAGEVVIERPPEPPANPFGNEPEPPPTLLWGEWRLERVGSTPAAAPIRLVFMHHQLDARSGCVALRWRLNGWPPLIRLERDQDLSTCERTLSADEQALVDILDGEVRVEALGPFRRRLTARAGTIVIAR